MRLTLPFPFPSAIAGLLGSCCLAVAVVAVAHASPPHPAAKSSAASSSKNKKPDNHDLKHDQKNHHEAQVHEPDETAPRVSANLDPDDPREQRIADLRRRLDELVHEAPLSRTRIGVAVVNAQDGDVLYAHNADRPFNPASNTKILTTAAALERLGADYRFHTSLHGPLPDEDGVVHGNVELRGSGNPALGPQAVAELARQAVSRGIKRIDGDLVADGKYRVADTPKEASGSGALVFNKNSYVIHVRPTERGKNASISIEPYAPEYFTVDNKVTTVPGRRTRIKLDGYRNNGRFVVVVKGRINPKAEARFKEKLGDGAGWSLATLKRALVDFGVELGGNAKSGGVDGDAPLLADHVSIPLAEICRISNKDSNNFVADTIFKTLGRECYGGAATLQKGVRAVDETLAPIGLGKASYHIVNGSGLTYENRIQPVALAQLLRTLYFDLAIAPDFLSSLAVGGIDGTIKTRFRGDTVGKVRAKTGTLSNVSALSGYVGDTGDVLVFTILIDNFHHRSLEEIRVAQVHLVREMMSYLRAGRPPSVPAATPVPVKIPLDDDADDDSDEPSDDGDGKEGAINGKNGGENGGENSGGN